MLIEELRADSKEQTAQIKRLTALVNSLASKSDAPPTQWIPPEIGAAAATEIIEDLYLHKFQ